MSINKPLTKSQVENLGLGFTPTSVGITGQQLKRAGRMKNFNAPQNNRKRTKGRIVQVVPSRPKEDKEGNAIVDASGNRVYTRERKIIHETPRRRLNV